MPIHGDMRITSSAVMHTLNRCTMARPNAAWYQHRRRGRHLRSILVASRDVEMVPSILSLPYRRLASGTGHDAHCWSDHCISISFT